MCTCVCMGVYVHVFWNLFVLLLCHDCSARMIGTKLGSPNTWDPSLVSSLG
jgi:hypothetical protein